MIKHAVYHDEIDDNKICDITTLLKDDTDYFRTFSERQYTKMNFCNQPTISSEGMIPYEKLFDKHESKTFVKNLVVTMDSFNKGYFVFYNKIASKDGTHILQLVLHPQLYYNVNRQSMDKDDIGRLERLHRYLSDHYRRKTIED